MINRIFILFIFGCCSAGAVVGQDYEHLQSVDSALLKARVSKVFIQSAYSGTEGMGDMDNNEYYLLNSAGQETERNVNGNLIHYFYDKGLRVRKETIDKYGNNGTGLDTGTSAKPVVELYFYSPNLDTATAISVNTNALQDTFIVIVVFNNNKQVIAEKHYANGNLSKQVNRDYDTEGRLVKEESIYYNFKGSPIRAGSQVTQYNTKGLSCTILATDSSARQVLTGTYKCKLNESGKLLEKVMENNKTGTYVYYPNGLIKQYTIKKNNMVLFSTNFRYTYF